MKNEKKYSFRDNFSNDRYEFASLREAKQAAKNCTYGFQIYIYGNDGEIAAIVNPNDKPLP